jgi:4-diphosphocytidyl-2-C-methyl-D-erythritol kinase
MRASAPAKINLALVVGPLRDDGKHEIVTVYQRIGIADRIELEPAPALLVEGFDADTLVRGALEALAARAGAEPRWHVRIEKRLPIAAGIGGGSSDAATALELANATLAEPLPDDDLRALAATLGADVPFFLADGPQIGTGDGGELAPIDLPQDFWVLLVVPRGIEKPSTASVYAAFDRRDGAAGFDERRAALLAALEQVHRPRDLAALPPNDLASAPLADELRRLGAFRADVTGAGPAVYGLFHHRDHAKAAQRAVKAAGETWLTAPAWYR